MSTFQEDRLNLDASLLTLWQAKLEGPVKIEDIAQLIHFSTKQTKRKLLKWSAEGWLTFTSGRGRGHLSELIWLQSVEEQYEQQLLDLMKKNEMEKVSKYLLFDWSTETKQRIINAFQLKFGFQHHNDDCLIIPKYYSILTTNPLHAADIHSANIAANLFNRVVALQEDGTILPELAYFWEYTTSSLTLYLRKDVLFHDGSVLVAEDVVDSFLRMKQDKHFSTLWEPITHIYSPAPLMVTLEFPKGCTYALQLISVMNASIFKIVNGKLFGTGGFLLSENTDEKTVLTAFTRYFEVRPLLDRVEFIKVPRDFEILYHSANDPKPLSTSKIESDSGFGVIVMNPYRDNSDMARKEIREYIHAIIAKHRNEVPSGRKRSTGNHDGCLIGYSKGIVPPPIHKPSINRPILLKYARHTQDTSIWLKQLLEQYGFMVEFEYISFEHMVNATEELHNADLFIHGEVFELNQSFSYFYFLRNSFSPLYPFTCHDPVIQEQLSLYNQTAFTDWLPIHLAIERYLQEESLCIPLYYEKRQIPFSVNMMNIQTKYFGYVDLTKLWIRD